MCSWAWASIFYVTLAILGFIPVLQAMLKRVKLNPGGDSFKKSVYFSDTNKIKLEQH